MKNNRFNYMSKTLISLVVTASIISPNLVQATELAKKDESVYITLDKQGNVQEKIVSDWLHNPEGGEIKDKSSLKDIKNVKGDEEPEINGQSITWKSKDNDIFYQGKTDKDLPLDVNISYSLNGQSIKPEELGGKSGKLKMVLDLKNKDAHSVTINGKEKTIYTPFTAIALVNLPIDNFKNVKVNSGELVSDGNNTVITYIGLPGLKESLGLDKKDINIGLEDKLEIEADVEGFKLGPVMITATPNFPEIEALKKSTNFSELVQGIEQLKEASGQLRDGATKLSEGESLFAKNMGDLVTGIDKLNLGSENLKQGAYQLKDGIDTVTKGMALAQGEMAKEENQKKVALITDDYNIQRERTLIEDAYFAKNMDISSTQGLMPYITENNMNLMGKTFVDYRAVGISKILASPMIEQIKALGTPENIKNIEALLNTTDALGNLDVDMSKLQPLLEVMKNIDKLAPFMGDLNSLAFMDLSMLDTLEPIFKNASALKNIVDSATALQEVNGKDMSEFLLEQQKLAEDFIKNTEELVKEENVNALKIAVDKAYPLDNEQTAVINKQLKTLVEGYNNAIIGARTGFINSNKKMEVMSENLKSLIGLQVALGENKEALESIAKGLNPENMSKLNEMITTLKTTQAKIQDEHTQAILKALNEVLTNKDVMGEVNKINEVLPAIQEMKNTLEVNKENIAVAKELLQMSNTKEFKEGIIKLNVLEADMKELNPLITAIENNMTPEVIEKLKTSPEALKQLVSMQNHLKESEDILAIMKESLEENNVTKARETLAKLPELTGGINQLQQGASMLYDGTVGFNKGLGNLSSGTLKLKDASNELAKGANDLKEGMIRFDEEGIGKLNDEVKGNIGDIDEILACKDEVIKLSENYGTFTGMEEGMEGKVKFIMKTEEIKLPEVKKEQKVEVKEEKKGFFSWIKGLFNN